MINIKLLNVKHEELHDEADQDLIFFVGDKIVSKIETPGHTFLSKYCSVNWNR